MEYNNPTPQYSQSATKSICNDSFSSKGSDYYLVSLKFLIKLAVTLSPITLLVMYIFTPYSLQRLLTSKSELVGMSEVANFYEAPLKQNGVQRIRFYSSEEQHFKNRAMPVVASVKMQGYRQLIALENVSTDLYMAYIEVEFVNERWVVNGSVQFKEVINNSSDRQSEFKQELHEAIAQLIVQIEKGRLMLI